MKTPNCWAVELGDCGNEGSKEHLVSAALFEGDRIDVVGFHWCKDEPKSVGIASLASGILCKKHNNALSPLDSSAVRAFDSLRRAAKLSNTRGKERLRKWKVQRIEVPDPWLLERWFLKTAINLIVVSPGENVWRQTGSRAVNPPRRLVRVAFGLEPMAQPMGLYAAVSLGEDVPFSDRVEFAPLMYGGANIIGGLFVFRGLRFVLHLEGHQLPAVLNVPGSTEQRWATSGLHYHLKRINWKVGRHLSHYLQFLWHLDPAR